MAGLGGVGLSIGVGVGGDAKPLAATDPRTIVTSVTSLLFLSADVGVTLDPSGSVSTDVSSWADPGTGLSATQATEANRPTLLTASLNGRHTLRFTRSSVQRLVVGTLDLPAPGTTPSFFWGIFKAVTNQTNDSVFGGGSSTRMRLYEITNNMRVVNGVIGSNVSITIGSWYRFEVLFNNSASADYLKVGTSSTGTGTAFGNNDAAVGAFTIGAQQSSGAGAGDIELACLGIWNGKPSSTELSSLDAWATAYYGTDVQV